jgi:hypothetical protein
MLEYLTEPEFIKRMGSNEYFTVHGNRWRYMRRAIEIMKRHNAQSCLEIGTGGMPITNGDTLDNCEMYPVTHERDARSIPWPVDNNMYDFTVALQVFEHFDLKRKKQRQVFNEMERVSQNIIISVPYLWESTDGIHDGIDDAVVFGWAGRSANESYLIEDIMTRKVYYWKVAK